MKNNLMIGRHHVLYLLTVVASQLSIDALKLVVDMHDVLVMRQSASVSTKEASGIGVPAY